MKRSIKVGVRVLGISWLCGVVPVGEAAPYVITTTDQRIEGTVIRAKQDGEIILTTPQGTRTFLPGQYKKAVADRPAEIDKVDRLISSKQYDEAVKLLEDIAIRYHYLGWDNEARAMLPKIYSQKGDFAAAIGAYEKLFASSPKSKEETDIQLAYRQALLNAKQYDKLEEFLNSTIKTGSRLDAARAFIMRGDIRAAQGQLDLAILDYQRTAILFESEKEVQPEALFKTAETFKALRDPRAAEFFKKLVDRYPDSPYAQKAK